MSTSDTVSAPERYLRHLNLAGVGPAGQARLAAGRVAVVGAGGLGSPVALYLAAAGVGHLRLIDGDTLDLSNLQRQVLYREADLGHAKARAAAQSLTALNSGVRIEPVAERLTAANAARLLAGVEMVIDATDNFASKFLINDTCLALGIALSHAGIAEFTGQTMTILPGQSACYRCLFEAEPAPSPSDRSPAGPLGPVPGIIGAIQAAECLRHLLGIGRLLTNRLLVLDALLMRFREVSVPPRPDCICRTAASAGGRR